MRVFVCVCCPGACAYVCVAVVKTPPGNLWLLAVMTPVALLLVVLGMVAFILCKRNRVIFKTSAFRTFKTRSKVSTSSTCLDKMNAWALCLTHVS